MSSKSWTQREFVNEFIHIYKNNPCLWQLQCVDYMNRIKRDQAYNQLLQLCKKTDPNVSVEFVKSKINSLRTSYRKELAKISNSITRGNNVYVPRLWYFNLLHFVKEQDTHGLLQAYTADGYTETDEHSQDTPPVLDIEDDQTESDNEQIVNIMPQQIPQNRKRQVMDNDQNLMIHGGNFQNQTDVFSINDREPDEFDALGVSVSKKLRKMDRLQQLFAENLINKALFLGSMGQLNINSDVQPISSYSNHHSPSASSTYTSN